MQHGKLLLKGALLAFLLCMLPIGAAAAGGTVGGDQGWITVYSNVKDGSVYFDNDYKGMLSDGKLSVAVYTTATPYKTLRVESYGYTTYYGSISSYPTSGQNIYMYAYLKPTSAPIGGSMGTYIVHCNEDGAIVQFDDDFKGIIYGGLLDVDVYTTGTPYSTYSVSKDGYNSFESQITQYPAAGERVDLYATLEPQLIGGDTGTYVVQCNEDGASVYFGNDYKGITTNGQLMVAVYNTGTPYTTYRVEKSGFTTFSGAINQYPAAGQAVNLQATLNPIPVTPVPSPMGEWLAFAALGIAGIGLAARPGRKQN